MQICKTVTDFYQWTLMVDFIHNLVLDSIKLNFSKKLGKTRVRKKNITFQIPGNQEHRLSVATTNPVIIQKILESILNSIWTVHACENI